MGETVLTVSGALEGNEERGIVQAALCCLPFKPLSFQALAEGVGSPGHLQLREPSWRMCFKAMSVFDCFSIPFNVQFSEKKKPSGCYENHLLLAP